jgi:hypothetical protein
MASIHSAAENKWIVDWAAIGTPQVDWSTFLWIGLSSVLSPPTFEWSDSSTVDYTAWRPGQPQYEGGVNQMCVILNLDDVDTVVPATKYTWDDGFCDLVQRGALCKKPANV